MLGMRPLRELFVPSWDSWEQDVDVVGDPADELDEVNAEMSRVKEELEAAEKEEKESKARPVVAEKEKRNIYFVSPTSKCPQQRPPATHRAQMNLTPKAGAADSRLRRSRTYVREVCGIPQELQAVRVRRFQGRLAVPEGLRTEIH